MKNIFAVFFLHSMNVTRSLTLCYKLANFFILIYYISTSSCDCIVAFDVLDPDINFADHLPHRPILTCVCTDSNRCETHNDSCAPSKSPAHYSWDRADLAIPVKNVSIY